MYSAYMIDIIIKDKDLTKIIDEGGEPLFNLCRKEAEEFSEFLQNNPGDGETAWLYKEGLTDWEVTSVASYIYQKLKRRL